MADRCFCGRSRPSSLRQGEARRSRLYGQAGRHRLGGKAAQRRYHRAYTPDRAGLKEITASLPQGIKADQIVFRQANFIETSIRNVEQVLLEAGAVVAVVLFVFLLNWRTTLISLTAIPVSILATAVVFYFAGCPSTP